MPYTFKDFQSDLFALREVVGSPEFDLPQSEWPQITLYDQDQTINLTIPQNNPLSRTLSHFQIRHGRLQGADRMYRFVMIQRLFGLHLKKLVKDNLVRYTSDGGFEVSQSLVEFLLDGFQEPQPPVLFPAHPLIVGEEREWTSYSKISAAFRRWQSK